ncbi:MAG TPA: 23S rRNA (uracil(1939)-C(5))-methyltransferase RlmD, partial [Bacilli bacterium]|nr:23S rRNA (uracil(1939)-C(5))-methyltransferase RlmD [Bacilli bacterium]
HDATEFLKQMVKDNVGIDLLVMDPPRSGSTTEFLNAILSLKPQKVIYVSCDPTTLVRDLKVLEGAYKIENKTIVDMFVGTYHIETVVSMSLKRN